MRENGRLLVPVAVNEKKEYRFLFDTGATTSVLSKRVAKKACVSATSVKRVGTFAGVVTVSMGRVDSLRIGTHEIPELEVLIADLGRLFNLHPEIEGILGQDVLSRFNYLLDRRRGKLEIEQDDSLLPRLSGTRVPCEMRGGKIYVPAAGADLHLILDSGNPYIVIYEDAASRLQPAANIKEAQVVESAIGSRAIRPFRVDLLEIGDSRLRNVDAYLAVRGPGRLEDGFLPLHIFDLIYVNNLENFLIANPRRLQ
jgi:predicted aspartyl protease